MIKQGGFIMTPITADYNVPVQQEKAVALAAKKDFDGNSYLKSREVNQLAEKFSSGGIYTEESSKILAKNILNGSVDIFA
jgi:hypothetical protein